jgi:hypothetical protein
MSPFSYIHVSGFEEVKTNSEKLPTSAGFQKFTSVDPLLQMESEINEKQLLPLVCYKWKTANHLFAANGNEK